MKRNMIPMRWTLVAVVALCTAMTGCKGGLVPFTQKVRFEFEAYLPEVQFYTSREIMLVRTSQSEEKSISDKGKDIEIRTDKTIESITIPSHTPGTLQGIEGDIFYVQFEPAADSERRIIPFVMRMAERSGAEGSLFVFDRETIEYDGKLYKILYEEGSIPVTETDGAVYADRSGTGAPAQFIATRFYPYLMIHPVQARANLKKKNRTVKGLKVGKTP